MIQEASAVETGGRALEVTVIWGEGELLRVDHLQPIRPYCVGEHGADLTLGAELLGTSQLSLVSASGALLLPARARGEVEVGGTRIALDELIASGRAQPEDDGWSYALPQGATARIRLGDLTFVVRAIDAVRVTGLHGPSFDYRAQLWTALSFAIHAVFVSAMYLMPPGASALSLDTLGDDTRLAKYLLRPAEVTAPPPEWLDRGGRDGAPAPGAAGQSGGEDAPKQPRRRAIRGDAAEQQLARADVRALASSAGILGVLRRDAPASETSPYGVDTAVGYDPQEALGAVFGDLPGESFGFRGATLRGPGRGGGNGADGAIGVGKLGTMGRSQAGRGSRYGEGVGGIGGRDEKVPLLRSGTPEVLGSLSKEVIRRVIHRHLNEVRYCYEQELSAQPELRGRVTVRFMIAPDGAVRSASVESSTLGARRAEACLEQAVRRFSFPMPEAAGAVIVSYPFLFDHS